MVDTPRTLACTRYITPLREGGSLPAVVEASDDGMYVMKFSGAGQGKKALVAELVAGLLGRALGLPIPELVFLNLLEDIPRLEGDDEVQQLLKASCGLNLGVDYLPGALPHDPAVPTTLDVDLASRVVWFDAVIGNVDRTARNTNLLWWHHKLWLIDHGASLTFHHDWETSRDAAPGLALLTSHVLRPKANAIPKAHAALAPQVTAALLTEIMALVPDVWLEGEAAFAGLAPLRAAYVDMVLRRLAAVAAQFGGGQP